MPTDQHEDSVEPTGDVEMTETNTQETPAENSQDVEGEQVENADETTLTATEEVVEPRVTFANYLMSPIVTLLIGSGDQSILSAHQGLLTQSPYFKDICDAFVEDGSVSTPRADHLQHTNVRSPVKSNSQTTTSTQSAAFSNTSTQANTSPRSSPASAS